MAADARDHGVRVVVAGVGEGARRAIEERADAPVIRGARHVQAAPEPGEARKLARSQPFDARILDDADGRHLQGSQALRRQRLAGRGKVCRRVRRHGAVEVRAARPRRVVEGVGQVDGEVGDERAALALAAGGGAQPEVAPPECPQVHRQAPVDVDEERALALLLQDGERLGAREREVA